MRKFLSLLIAFSFLLAQAQTVTKYPVKTGQDFGIVVYKSTKAPAKAPLIVFLHGITGRGTGTASELEKLVNDFPAELKAGIEKYGFICAAVQSNAAFTLNEPGFARNWAFKNLPVDTTRKYLTGLSWGGGGSAGFVKASLANAMLFDAVAPIAMTTQAGSGYRYIAEAKTPIWIFHNLADPNGGTPAKASKDYYDSVLSWKPDVAPALTLFNRDMHGGWGEAYNPDKVVIAPGSQGVTAPTVNLLEWFLLNSSSNRVPVPLAAPSCTDQSAVIAYTLTGTNIYLDAKRSCAYKSAEWRLTARPAGVSEWAPIITSGARWETATGIFPAPGIYSIELTTYSGYNYNGTEKKTSITVTVGTPVPDPPKQVTSYDLVRRVVTFVDGSQEAIASATYNVALLKLTIVTEKGGTYSF